MRSTIWFAVAYILLSLNFTEWWTWLMPFILALYCAMVGLRRYK